MTAARLSPGPLLARTLCREQAVLFFRALVERGLTLEKARRRAAEAVSFKASATSVRRWTKAYERAGFVGLVESKLGRVGRKPKGKG